MENNDVYKSSKAACNSILYKLNQWTCFLTFKLFNITIAQKNLL